jgi:type VI secretion system protein ImpK
MTSSAPSLTAAPGAMPVQPPIPAPLAQKKTLLDIFYDGFLMIFLLKSGHAPKSLDGYVEKLKIYLDDVKTQSNKLGIDEHDFNDAKYAFCATIDEMILRSDFSVKDEWLLRPLQLTMFGDQLAGENFFKRLDRLREAGPKHLPAIEVFYMCLLMGFQGHYIFDGKEKLQYYILKLAAEITNMRGNRTGFAPHAPIPDHVRNALKSDLPIWAIAFALIFLGAVAFAGVHYMLGRNTQTMLSQYQNIIDIGPRSAHLTISLP